MVHEGKDVDVFQCNLCDKSFNILQVLKKHIQLCHESEIRTFECKICKKMFKNKNYLKKHFMEMHSSSAIYECDICSQVFKRPIRLVNHIRKMHFGQDDKTKKCPDCHKSFQSEKSLKGHFLGVHSK